MKLKDILLTAAVTALLVAQGWTMAEIVSLKVEVAHLEDRVSARPAVDTMPPLAEYPKTGLMDHDGKATQ